MFESHSIEWAEACCLGSRYQASSLPPNEGVGLEACMACQQSLAGGVQTLPWEDGDNPDAYVTCPHCGEENPLWGFGEDDD